MEIDAFGHLLDIDAPETIQCVVCRATAERLSSTWHGDGIAHHHYRCRSDTYLAGGTIVEHENGDPHRIGPVFGDPDLAVRRSLRPHQVSAVSDHADGAERKSDKSGSDIPVEGGSGDTNHGFKPQKLNAKRKRAPVRTGVLPSNHFITKPCVEAYHKLGNINSAEGESHLPAGRSDTCTCFFPAQDNIACHSPSDGYRLLSSTTARAANSLGHDDSPGRQRWKNGAHQ